MRWAERRWGDPRWQVAGFALAHVAIFAALFRGIYSMPYSGTGLYYEYGSALVAGKVPYRDIFVEYPPFALVFFTLPRVFGASFRWYYVFYQTQVVVADLVVLLALSWAREKDTPPWRVLAPYSVLLIAVGPISLQQYDLFPAAITLLAVVCLAKRRDTAAWVLLALGTMTKVYPVLLAPVFLLTSRSEAPFARRAIRSGLVFAATCIVVLLPLLVIAPASLERMIAFHSERGLHLDSTYSSIAFAARALGLSIVGISLTFRSWNIFGPAADVLVRLATPVLALSLIGAWLFVWRHTRKLPADEARDVRVIATSSSLVLLTGLVTSKVLSPQYLIWVLPLLPLMAAPRRLLVWEVFTAVGLLTYYIYPLRYNDLLGRDASAIAALAARNLLLVVLTFIVAGSLRRFCDARAAGAPSRSGASGVEAA